MNEEHEITFPKLSAVMLGDTSLVENMESILMTLFVVMVEAPAIGAAVRT
jgi:hypothetical protein